MIEGTTPQENDGVIRDDSLSELDKPIYNDPRYLADLEALRAKARPKKASDHDLEQAAALHEMGEYRSRKEKMDNQDEITQERPGRILSERDFLRKLRKINSSFDYAGPILMGLRQLTWRNSSTGAREPIEGCAIQAMYAKEWSEMHTNEWGVATGYKYKGWRDVLMRLIMKEIITEAAVDRVFGKPEGRQATRWLRTLYLARNNRCAACGEKACQCDTRFKYDYLRSDNADFPVDV